MFKRTYLLAIVLFFIGNNIFAQNYEFGLQVGANSNLVSIKSDYTINENIEISPKISFNGGCNFKFKKGNRGAILFLEYYRLYNETAPRYVMTIFEGNAGGYAKPYIVNYISRLSPVVYLTIINDVYIGAGVSANINLKSTLKFKSDIEFPNENYGNSFALYNFRKMNLSIPIIIGYEIDKWGISLAIDKGIMDRLSGDNFSDEINNVISLNFNYRLIQF